ncbi:MAG: Stp1/IreP family PP2C-type Ser/Thr phosphatase [Candidatus Zixiibacteriota bacterium]
MALKLSYYGRTDQGLVRPANEDNLLMLPERNLFVVCDGMGGHSAGEVASRTAVGAISATFNFDGSELADDPLLNLEEDLPQQADLLVKSIRLANRRIHSRGNVDPNLNGMGTTVVGTAFSNKLVSITHVGDSRVYLFRNRALTPLTSDHSWVAEVQAAGSVSEETASTLVNKNIITRALGVKETVEIDVRLEEIQSGDLYVLCSDGLCGYSTDTEIERVIYNCKGDPRKSVDNLIQLANDRGGSDNVTVICIKVEDTDKLGAFRTRLPITIPVETSTTIEREDEWLETLADRNRELLEKEAKSERIAVESPQTQGARGFMVLTLLVLLALSVVFYLFFGESV